MIKKYTKKDGSTAYMYVAYLGVDPTTGKQKRTTRRGFKTERDAKLSECKLLLEVEKNGFYKKQNNKMTFQELCNIWLTYYESTVKESTFVTQKRVIELHILPLFKHLYVDKISVAYCQKQVNHWYDNYMVNCGNIVSLTKRILDYAINLGIIYDNPMDKVIRPKKQRVIDEKESKLQFYNKNQVQFFLSKIQNEDLQTRLMFRLLIYTGMRKSELLALRWKDIDFKNNTISINQTLATGKNSIIFQTPKTKKSKRTISLDKGSIEMLQQWDIVQKKDFLALGITGINKSSLVFIDSDNKPFYTNHINNALNRLIKKYDLPPITPHGLRHTHCSLLFESGATMKEVQERLGHTNVKTTIDIYTHVTEKAKEQTAYKFAKYISF